VSGGWLDVQGPAGTRREALLEGLTRVGGPGTDIVLEGLAPGSDELQVWNRPPRLLFLGRGERPRVDGREVDEHPLRPGDRLLWGGHTLTYGGEAAHTDVAALEEIPLPVVAPPLATPSASRLSTRVRAGLACELGLADPRAVKRWREEVLAKRFDPDACARELLPNTLGAEAEERLLERSGTLLRDFLMAATLRGLRGAGRRVREKTRSLVAFLVAQTVALLVFLALVAAALLVWRAKGTSIDAFLDRFLPG